MNRRVKIFLLLVFVFILTGCKANYTIIYEDDKFTEKLSIIPEEFLEDEAHPSYEDAKNKGVYADLEGKEKFQMDSDSTKTNIKLTHELKDDNLGDLSGFSECFSLHTYKETDNSIYYAAHGDFYCDNLNNKNTEGEKLSALSTFTLQTSAEVLNHNANEVKDNKYIWYLDSDHLSSDGIIFQIMKTKDGKSATENSGKSSMIPWYVKVIVTIIVVGVLFGTIFVLSKRN